MIALIVAREREHLVGHVDAVGLACGADTLRRQQHVDAAARSEVQDRLSRLELEQGRRVAAAERRGDRGVRQRAGFRVGVEIRRDRVAAPTRGRPAAAAVGCGLLDRGGDGAVLLADRPLDV